ncbi:MAG TPA: hypothetical protein VF543_09195 [Pyrinomonadaceae bacterium]|jgi:hypothetical protein
MLTRLKLGLLLLTLVITATTTATISHSQQKQATASLKKTINDEVMPVTDFNKALPADPKERDKRQKRNKRRNIKLGKETGVFDPTPFMLTEERYSAYGRFSTHATPEPAIPAAKSDVVITGEVIKAEAFLTEDKVSIYSEFTVRVNSILKNSTSEEINVGKSITISRGGGGVRFPSGKIIKTLFEGKPMPRVGSRYVLFLNYENAGGDYPLITAYELKNGTIIPLDGLDRDGKVIIELASHQSYKGSSEIDFLNLVQLAISSSRDMFEKQEGQ